MEKSQEPVLTRAVEIYGRKCRRVAEVRPGAEMTDISCRRTMGLAFKQRVLPGKGHMLSFTWHPETM